MSIVDAELSTNNLQVYYTGLCVDESKYAIQLTKDYYIILCVTSAVPEVKLTDSK